MITDGEVRYHDALAPLMRDIDSLQQHPENPNEGDVDAVVEGITTSGMYRPIYVQAYTNTIVAGHTTWTACKLMGAKRIPVIDLDIDDVTAVRIVLGDNKIARRAKMNQGLELKLLMDLADFDSLIGSGYTPEDLANLQALNEIPLDLADEHRNWPSLCFQVHPRTKEAFLAMTDVAGGDRERFELLMRRAGWAG